MLKEKFKGMARAPPSATPTHNEAATAATSKPNRRNAERVTDLKESVTVW